MKLQKKHKRLLAYVGILGGAAVLSLTLFTVSQYEKAKCKAAIDVRDRSEIKLNDVLAEDKNALTDDTSNYHEAALYWQEVNEHFKIVVSNNSAAYMGTAIPAYILSMSTLVAFGLILKHAETAKEKEDEEAVLRPQQ